MHRIAAYIAVVISLTLAFLPAATAAESAGDTVTSATTEFSDGLAGELENIAASHQGEMGIYCRHLENGEVYAVNSDVSFPTASTIKVAIMAAAMDLLIKGEGPFETYYSKKKYDASRKTGGSGLIQNYKDGTELELKELIHLMITISDNNATNMLCEWMGLDAVNDWLSKSGFQKTRIFSTVGGSEVYDAEGRKTWGLGRTTPREMANLMASIARGRSGSTSSTDEMLRVLGNQYFDDSIAGAVPPTVYVGSKSGAVNQSRSDAAIVAAPTGTYVLAVFTKNNKDTSWTNSNEAEQAIFNISRAAWKHFNPDSEWERPDGAENF